MPAIPVVYSRVIATLGELSTGYTFYQ